MKLDTVSWGPLKLLKRTFLTNAYMYGKQCEIMQIILQCNRKKGKAIQSLGAYLHWHKRGTFMPSQIPRPTWALICLWNSRGIGWLVHLMTSCQEPTYDERLTWEGRSDKMVQVWKIIKQSLNQQMCCPNNMVKILKIDSFAFRATRCVRFTMITISWIMLFSYTGVQNWSNRELYFHNSSTLMLQTRNQDVEYIEA